MKFRKTFLLCVAVCYLSAPVGALAIGTLEDQGEDIFSLGEVVVSGHHSSTQSGQIINEITSGDIEKSSARTLDEALNLLSEVYVRTGNEGIPRVNIRGFKSRHVLLLLDGIPMNSSYDQQFDPSQIPVDQIAKIQVTSGASSVLYGQGGLGGVINIITKKGQRGLSGKASYEAGDGQPYLAKGSVSGGAGITDFFVSGSAYKRDYFPLAKSFDSTAKERSGYRENSDNERNSVFANLGMALRNDLYVAVTGNWVKGSYGKPASAINDKFDPFAPPERFGRVPWYEGFTIQLAADYTPTDLFNLRTAVFYNSISQDNVEYDDENYDSYDDDKIGNTYKMRNTGITRGVSVKPNLDFGSAGVVSMGLSAEWHTWKDKGVVKTGTGSIFGVGGGSPPYFLVPKSNHKDLYIYSAALEYHIEPTEKSGLTIGYAHHWQVRDEARPDDYSVSVSAYYDLFENTRLKAAYQRNIRFPSLSQLYQKDKDNPDLGLEKVYHYQAGVEQYLSKQTLLKIEGFYSEAHDFIALDQTTVPAKNTNYSLFRFTGVQTSLDTRLWERLTLKASYTHLHSKDFSGSGQDELQYVPKNKFSCSARYDFGFGLTPFVSLNWVADTYVYTKYRYPNKLKAKMDDYLVVNLKLSQRLWHDRLTLFVGADNLFNENYEQSYGVPRPGRFIFGGAEIRFNI